MQFEQWDRLRPIGLTPPVMQALAALDARGEPMRVTEVHRDSVIVARRRTRASGAPAACRAARTVAARGRRLGGRRARCARRALGVRPHAADQPAGSPQQRRPRAAARQQRRHGAAGDGPRRRLQPAPPRALPRHGHASGPVARGRADQGGPRRRRRRATRRSRAPDRRARRRARGERARPVVRGDARAVPRRRTDAGAARLVGRGQVDADQRADRPRRAGHRRGARGRQPRPPHHHRRARCTGCPAAPASSTRRDCAVSRRTSTKRDSRRASRTSSRWHRNAASAIARTPTSRAARCAPAWRPTGWPTTRSCCATSGATR